MSLETFHNILIERDGGVAILTINRPKVLNALNTQTLDELRRAMLALRHDDSVRAVIVTGSGEKSFIAGADINELAVQTPTGGRDHAMRGQHVFDLIEHLGKPVIAAINGYALGGGCELAMACTMRIAADTAKLGQPEINLGIIPGYAGTQRLARLVGRGRALELLLTGDQISAAEALRLGLVNRVVPAAELMSEARKLARVAGREGADRRALHHRRGEQGTSDAVPRRAGVRGDALRAGRDDRRHARRHAGVPRKAHSRSSRGNSACVTEIPRRLRRRFPERPATASRSSSRASTRRSPSRCATAARAALTEAGAAADDVEELSVPGAFELPQAARCAAESGRFDAVICLGCVIRGETPHFEYISSAVAHGIMEAAGETGVPMAFGVLTTDTQAQAEERAGDGRDNKGFEAAAAALEMAVLFRRLGRPPARAGAAVRFGFEPGPTRGTATEPDGRQRPPARPRSGAADALPMGSRPRPARTRPSRRTGRRTTRTDEMLGEPLREFANSLVRGTIARVTEHRRSS